MGQEKLYIEKELSWLSFNERVLQEAADKSNPLIERMRFLGIYSNNLDEFYKVRFAELKRRIIISEEQGSTAHSRHLLGKIQAAGLAAQLLQAVFTPAYLADPDQPRNGPRAVPER